MNENVIESLAKVRLSIRAYTAARRSAEIEREVEASHNADNAVRAKLVVIGADWTAPITKIQSAARAEFYRRTLPWEDGGWRVIPAAQYLKLEDGIATLRGQLRSAVADMLSHYDDILADSKRRLNGLFQTVEFPSLSRLSAAYDMDFGCYPVQSPNDARIIGIGEAQQEKMREKMRADYSAQVRDGVVSLCERIRDVVLEASARFGESDGKGQRLSRLIARAKRVADEVRTLNITEDGRLKDIADRLENTIGAIPPDAANEVPALRQAAHNAAVNILDAVNAVSATM